MKGVKCVREGINLYFNLHTLHYFIRTKVGKIMSNLHADTSHEAMHKILGIC